MTEKYNCSDSGQVLIFPCSGGNNCGQITNEVATSLDVLGIGRFYCLAGIGAHIDSMVEFARGARRIVALDGCDVACAKKTIEHAGLTVNNWICVTEEGIAKNDSLLLEQEEIELITQRAKELLTMQDDTAE